MNRAFPALLAPTLYRMMTLKFRQRRPAGRWFGGPRARSSARNRESTRRKSRKNPRCPPGASALQSASMPGATPCPTISAAARGIIAAEGGNICVCCGREVPHRLRGKEFLTWGWPTSLRARDPRGRWRTDARKASSTGCSPGSREKGKALRRRGRRWLIKNTSPSAEDHQIVRRWKKLPARFAHGSAGSNDDP